MVGSTPTSTSGNPHHFKGQPLREFVIEGSDLSGQLLQKLKEIKTLRSITFKKGLKRDGVEIEDFVRKLLDLNRNIIQINNHSYTDVTKFKVMRNIYMRDCEEKKSGVISVEECENTLQLHQFLEHKDWDEIITRMSCPLQFKLKTIKGDIFDDERVCQIISSEKVNFVASTYICGQSFRKPIEQIDHKLLKVIRIITNEVPSKSLYRKHYTKALKCDFKLTLDLVRRNANVLSVSLIDIGMEDNNLYELSRAIKTNNKMVCIDLSKNKFTITASKAFLTAVAKNKYITHVYMKNVDIEGRHLKSLVNILSGNSAILELSIHPSVSENNVWSGSRYHEESYMIKRGYFKKDKSHIDRYLTRNQGYRDQAIISIQTGNINKLKKLLQRGVSPNATDEEGRSLLHHTVMKRRYEMFSHLVALGANVDLRDDNKKSCIDLCQNEKDKEKFLVRINHPKQVGIRQFFSPTQVNKKMRKRGIDDLSVMESSQSKRVKLSELNSLPVTLDEKTLEFQVACQNGDLNLMRKILAGIHTQNARLNVINSRTLYGKTPAHLAACGGHLEVLRDLIKSGADLSACDFAGRLPLHDAIVCKKPDRMVNIVQCLLDHNASHVDAKDKHGITPLYLLAGGFDAEPSQTDSSRAAAAYALLAKGAKANVVVKDFHLNRSMCALHKAIFNGFYSFMKAVVESRSSNINQQDDRGWGPLHYAVMNPKAVNTSIIKRLLIEPKLNLRLANFSQETPFALLKKLPDSPAKKEMEKYFTAREARHQLGDSQSGIVWTKSLKVLFGARKVKDLVIDLSDTHESLRNSVKRRQNDKGNSVSARLMFIVSDTTYAREGQHRRICIPVKLVFAEKIHSSNMWQYLKPVGNTSFFKPVKRRSPDALERILGRYKAAPSDIKRNCIDDIASHSKKPLSTKAIQKAYVTLDYKFERTFHHSEQALFDHLENQDTIREITEELEKQPQFKKGAKVYGVILSIHSKFYVCPNCEISALGEHEILSNNLGKALKKLGYKLPKRGIKVLTTVTTDFEAQRQKQTEEDHGEYAIDFRSLKNNGLILSQDTRMVGTKDTMYVSRRS